MRLSEYATASPKFTVDLSKVADRLRNEGYDMSGINLIGAEIRKQQVVTLSGNKEITSTQYLGGFVEVIHR